MRQKHADLIHAWAEGAEIEIYDPCIDQWNECSYPSFVNKCKYRIKPEKKPDVVKLYYKADEIFRECLKGEGCTDKHDLCCTFDGDTGELKSAEVIK
jgi:hypothetical protein